MSQRKKAAGLLLAAAAAWATVVLLAEYRGSPRVEAPPAATPWNTAARRPPVPAEERAAPPRGGASLSLVCAETGAAVEGGGVHGLVIHGTTLTHWSAPIEHGVVSVPAGLVAALVNATERLAVLIHLESSPGGVHTVPLPRASRLGFLCRTASGDPVRGVAMEVERRETVHDAAPSAAVAVIARLLDSAAAAAMDAAALDRVRQSIRRMIATTELAVTPMAAIDDGAFVIESNDDGEAQAPVDIGSTYTWRVVSKHAAAPDPATLPQPAASGGHRVSTRGDPRSSAPILIEDATSRWIPVTIHLGASLSGRIAGVTAAGRPLVKLFDVHRTGSEAQPAEVRRFAASVYAEADGRFLFDPVLPGPKSVVASWTCGEDEFHFAESAAEVLPMERTDMGEIVSSAGPPLVVEVVWRVDGQDADSGQAILSNTRGTIPVDVECIRLKGGFQERALLRWMRPARVYGVIAGEVHVSASLPDDFAVPGDLLLHRREAAVSAIHPSSSSHVLAFDAETARTMSFHAHLAPADTVLLRVVHLDRGHMTRLRMKADRGDGATTAVVKTAPGRHEYLAQFERGGAPSGVDFGEVIVADLPITRHIHPAPGVEVSGRIRASASSSEPRLVFMTFPSWARLRPPVHAFSAQPDEHGAFVIPNVPGGIDVIFPRYHERRRSDAARNLELGR